MKKTTVAAVLLVLIALVTLGVITAIQPAADPSGAPSVSAARSEAGQSGDPASAPAESEPSAPSEGPGESNAPIESSAPEASSAPTESSTPEESSRPPKDPQKKYVAFTFDDGPYSPVTSKLLDKLESIDGRATFFVVGNRLNDSTGSLLARASSLGCEIGSHSYTHTVYFNNCTDAQMENELAKTQALIRKYTGADALCMRPPGGSITESRKKSCGYAVIIWSVDSIDWKLKGRQTESQRQENVDAIVNNVLSTVRDGDIILMHDLYENTLEAFCRIADTLKAQGYEFVTVSELLELNAQSVGKKYFRVGLTK